MLLLIGPLNKRISVMANMMTMAAYEGLDSCPLEGFNQDDMTALLGDELGLFDTNTLALL